MAIPGGKALEKSMLEKLEGVIGTGDDALRISDISRARFDGAPAFTGPISSLPSQWTQEQRFAAFQEKLESVRGALSPEQYAKYNADLKGVYTKDLSEDLARYNKNQSKNRQVDYGFYEFLQYNEIKNTFYDEADNVLQDRIANSGLNFEFNPNELKVRRQGRYNKQAKGTPEEYFNERLVQFTTFVHGESEAINKGYNVQISMLKQQLKDLDPHYYFGGAGKTSEEKLQHYTEDFEKLKDIKLDLEDMKSEIENANPKFDFSRLDSMGLEKQFSYLSKYTKVYQDRIANLADLQNKMQGMSHQEFNAAWTHSDKHQRWLARAAWGDVDGVRRYRGEYFRDEGELGDFILNVAEQANSVADDVGAFTKAWDDMSRSEKNQFFVAFGPVDTFKGTNGQRYAIKRGVFPTDEETQAEYMNFLSQRERREVEEFGDQAFQNNSWGGPNFYSDRPVQQFEAQQAAVADAVEGQQIWRPSASQSEAAVEETNAIAAEMTEMNTVGETPAAGIERRAANSILAVDTARSYVFGYRQRALLGMMGTIGGVSLMEAAMNGPSSESIERRRKLTEERRLRDLGY